MAMYFQTSFLSQMKSSASNSLTHQVDVVSAGSPVELLETRREGWWI